MEIRLQTQQNPVADQVSALTAVVRPILQGVLYALKRPIVGQVGGYEAVRLSRPGDGDCGICFEYAVHDAVSRFEPSVMERVNDALGDLCRLPGQEPASILFGAEKTGAVQLIDTARDRLTEDSSLLSGSRGRPVKLRRHIETVAAAFRRPEARANLPQSINGLWKADLFLGYADSDRWVGTSVKVNPALLEPARGLRIGIVPATQGNVEPPFLDDRRNLVVCPLTYDGAFMETFYQGWQIVKQFLAADAQMPSEASLPRPADRQVVRYLLDRRDFPVVEVIDALHPLAQPELLHTEERPADVVLSRVDQSETTALLAPTARTL
jgi:hypothetical protein